MQVVSLLIGLNSGMRKFISKEAGHETVVRHMLVESFLVTPKNVQNFDTCHSYLNLFYIQSFHKMGRIPCLLGLSRLSVCHH